MPTPAILVINPNTSTEMTRAIDRVAQAAAGPQAHVTTRQSVRGPHTIEGPLDAALGVAGMLEVVGAYHYSFDAVVVACFGDPGVDALRMLVRVPVVGIGAASFIQAGFLSQRFAIVTPAVGTPARYAAVAADLGLTRQFVGTYPTTLAVADFESGDPAVTDLLAVQATRAVADGAECLLFGCAGIADQIRDIAARVGVLCIPSVAAGVTQAIACVSHRQTPLAGGPFRRVNPKPLEGFNGLVRHYEKRT